MFPGREVQIGAAQGLHIEVVIVASSLVPIKGRPGAMAAGAAGAHQPTPRRLPLHQRAFLQGQVHEAGLVHQQSSHTRRTLRARSHLIHEKTTIRGEKAPRKSHCRAPQQQVLGPALTEAAQWARAEIAGAP